MRFQQPRRFSRLSLYQLISSQEVPDAILDEFQVNLVNDEMTTELTNQACPHLMADTHCEQLRGCEFFHPDLIDGIWTPANVAVAVSLWV